MRVATICICLVVMIALTCAQQQQQSGKSGKQVGHKQQKNFKVDAAVSHGKQGVKSAKNTKSKPSNIKAEWKTETLVVEVSPSQKSYKKVPAKAEVPVIEKNTIGKKNVRSAVNDRTTFAQKKQRSVEVPKADETNEEENTVEEEEHVVVVPKQKKVVMPKQKKVVAKPVKLAKKPVDETEKEKPCPCSAAKMEVVEEDVDESIDEVAETPCAAAAKAKVAKKSKASSCRKVVEEEEAATETPCSKKAKRSSCTDATLSCKKIAKASKTALSTKPIKQCPLDAMVQCAKGYERDAATNECKPSTGCAVKKDKVLKKIGIRLPAKHSVTVKQNENNSEDFMVDIVSSDEKSNDEQEFSVTSSDDVEIVDDEERDEVVCEMCTRD